MASPPLYQQRSCPYRLEKAQAKRGQRLTRAEHAVYAPEAPTGDLQPAIHIATRYKHGWVTSIPKSAVCAPCLNLPEGEKRPGSFSLIPRQLQGLVRRPHRFELANHGCAAFVEPRTCIAETS